ncbi:MAG: multidrug efflux RND transporter permease subunit [Thermoguttaceae bacterium]|jgi:HAE1 family hydrophobic/amphiphilic exporter-1|nr:multidrug efflux RND transporter permease subunit [Thermoguttaceae bacterium]
MSRFFIERPIFATVISLVIVLIGGITIPLLPVEQTPDITPPTVVVSTTYPGASPEVVAETVGVPIEEQVNGVENMIYMSSQCTDDGGYQLTITFEVGTDVDMANVLVQNRVNIAMPRLPEEVKREGVKTDKRSTNMVLMVNMISPDRRFDEIYLSNYVGTQIKDVLARVPGVGSVQVMGAKDFGMRLWLDPNRLRSMQLTTSEVVQAIREQNVQVAAGQIGAPPSPPGQQFQYTVNTLGRLSDPEQFAGMILKVGEEGRLVRVRDVARVELGAQAYNWSVELDGAPSVAVAVYQLPGANALQIADGIRREMESLKQWFPEGLDYTIVYDLTTFVRAAIEEVIITLFVAVALVIFTVYVFLQDIRTTFIPAITIPVSLIGTFAVMLALGISINTLSLFGLVLVIGIVVDDAIVVVENTKRILDEEGLSPKEATLKSMRQVTGPVIATTLVLLAVFVPTALMGGITGRLYRQFAMTIATATVFSSINALTLSPALCGVLLRPSARKQGWFFRGFNWLFDRSTGGYMTVVRVLTRRVALPLAAFAGIAAASFFVLDRVPGGFIPDEDQGYFIVSVELPDAATLERTERVVERINKRLKETPGVANVISVTGYSALDALMKTNAAAMFVILQPWGDRNEAALQIESILGGLQPELLSIQEAICFAFPPPPIQGLGNASGFELRLQDRGNAGLVALQQAGDDLVLASRTTPVLARMNSNFRATVPQLFADVDRVEARKLGIPLTEIFSTLQAYLGSAYVNDFNIFGRTFKVQIQADAQYRSSVADIARLDVRNAAGRMIPLETVVNMTDTAGPTTVFRYNMYPSTTVTGQPAPGFASGQAIAATEQLAAALPSGIGYEWSGVTFQQIRAGNVAPVIFALAIVFVYFFLAAQYESWAIPVAVMLSVPLAVFGAAVAIWVRAYDNNIYTQIGLVLLIGLSAKSAILIVEFAKQRRSEGMAIADAAVEASHLRFRAILMTAFSFILGVVPLVIATGAGAASRRALGTAVFGGMLAGTVLGVFFIPVLYVAVQRMSEWITRLKQCN